VLAADSEVAVTICDVDRLAAANLAAGLGDRARAVDDYLSTEPTVVVLATPAPHAPMAARCLARRVAVVSVGDDLTDVRDMLALDTAALQHAVPLVVGAAMSPGLSGLLARQLAARLDEIDEIHVASHGTGGPACARQHHRSLAGSALNWHDRSWTERTAGSGRELCWFPEPLGAWDCYRADVADPLLLVRSFPDARRVSARMSANRRDRLTARLPMLSPPHREGGLGGLRVEVRGSVGIERVALVAGVAERAAIVAAAVAATMALAVVAGEVPSGLVVTGRADLPTARLLERISDGGIALREFVGTEERTGW
jgi:hypothetical protein